MSAPCAVCSRTLTVPYAFSCQCPVMSAGPRCVRAREQRSTRRVGQQRSQQHRLTRSPPPVRSRRFEFLFEDGSTYKKPTALPACEYVDALMNWVQSLLDDEEIFPSRIGPSPPLPPLRTST